MAAGKVVKAGIAPNATGVKEGSAKTRLDKPFNLFGVEFAPLLLPVERRLQTLGVLFTLFVTMQGTTMTFSLLSIYLMLYTSFWWLPLLYFVWYAYDFNTCETGGRDYAICSKYARNWRLWHLGAAYGPIKLVKTHDLDPEKTYLLGYHPHGVLPYGAVGAFATDAIGYPELFPHHEARLLTLRLNLSMPFGREIGLLCGSCSASKRGMKALLSKPKGTAAVLVVGGASEALNVGDKKRVKLYLIRRKGFIKLALEHGTDLVPVFGFGESNAYEQLPNPEGSLTRRVQNWLEKNLTFTLPLFYGRGVFQYSYGIVPHRRPITVVVGSPINVPKNANPSNEDVAALHAKYIAALQALYDKYNPVYGNPDLELVVA